MNRLQLLSPPKNDLPDSTYEVEQSLLKTSQSGNSAYSIFVPLHYEKKYEYPLLIWLHGPGDNENQLKRVVPLISMRNYVAIGPRGTSIEENSQESERTYRWQQQEREIELADQQVFDCIERVRKKYSIADSRIFLAGYSYGGTMALRLGMNHPEKFAGVLSLGGAFPRSHMPLQNIERARHLPLVLSHGRDNPNYTVDDVCCDLRLLHSAGMSVTLFQYPAGDEITTKMLSDIDSWIMERVTGGSGDEATTWSGEEN